MQVARGTAISRSPCSFRAIRQSNPRRANARVFMPARALSVGDKAPDFSLQSTTGKTVKLSSYSSNLLGLGNKPVVLYFYPSDASPGCTKQAKAFKDSISKFKAAGAEVLGISGQDLQSKADFVKDLQLPFPLLADDGDQVRELYGVKKDLLGLLNGRETFVIDKDGTILLKYNNQFDPESHVEKALSALSA